MSKANKRARVKATKEREKKGTGTVGKGVNAKQWNEVTHMGMPLCTLFILSIFAIGYSSDNGDAERAVVRVTQLIVKDFSSLSFRSPLDILSCAGRTIFAHVTIENLVIAALLLNVGMGIAARSVKND